MEINHPGAAPLTPEEQALLERFRQQLHERAATTGLSSEDIRRIIEGMREHPHASTEAVRILMQEARELVPGQRLLSFDWE
jgi:DNA-binding transcriptional MerR regulator